MLDKMMLKILKYVGFIGSIITSIAYIAVVVVLINGFKADQDLTQQITFSIITTIVGLIILELLKLQGIELAKDIESNREIISSYYGAKTRDKTSHSLRYYWITSVIKDVIVKGGSFIVTTFGVIYICVQGSNDYSLLLLGIVNLLMFVCFGILALCGAYENYNNSVIPYMKERLEECHSQKTE